MIVERINPRVWRVLYSYHWTIVVECGDNILRCAIDWNSVVTCDHTRAVQALLESGEK